MDNGWMDSGPYFFFQTAAELQHAVATLRALPTTAHRLLSECMEHQELVRQRASVAARALEAAGFVMIRDTDGWFSSQVRISPTLAGEEAMLALEEGEAKSPARGRRT
jgi:hypothetical protein